MVVTRYNTISPIPGVMSLGEYECATCEPVGEYCVDTTHFVPACEAGAVAVSAGDLAGNGAYDFADGKDTGVQIPRSRLHSYTGDLAEASVNFKEAQAVAKESIDNAKIAYVNAQADAARSAALSGAPSGAPSGASK